MKVRKNRPPKVIGNFRVIMLYIILMPRTWRLTWIMQIMSLGKNTRHWWYEYGDSSKAEALLISLALHSSSQKRVRFSSLSITNTKTQRRTFEQSEQLDGYHLRALGSIVTQNECSFDAKVNRVFSSDRALKGPSIGWFFRRKSGYSQSSEIFTFPDIFRNFLKSCMILQASFYSVLGHILQ